MIALIELQGQSSACMKPYNLCSSAEFGSTYIMTTHMNPITKAPDAALRTISLEKLTSGDATTRLEMLAACIEVGFFYLDCNSFRSGRVVDEVDRLYSTMKTFYDLPQEEKDVWAVDKDHGEDLPVCG